MSQWKNAAVHQAVPTHGRMNTLVILGTLGSGKTTTIVELLAHTPKEELDKLHLVINEVGTFAVDIDRVNQASGGKLDVAGITAGCLGCANLAQFIEIVESLSGQDGLLVIEPTGVADGNEICSAVARFEMPWHCLTLINPLTFEDDMKVGVLESQLEVATIVGITRPDELSAAGRDRLLLTLAPYGVPVIDVPLGSPPSMEDLMAHGHVHHHHHDGGCGCSCGHDHSHSDVHHHHNHDHNHGGYITTPVMLHDNVTVDALRDVCEALNVRRVKGVVQGVWFDCVGGVFTVGEKRDEEAYAIFIDTEPLPVEIISSLSVKLEVAPVSLKQRLAGENLSQAEAHGQIDRLLAQAGEAVDSVGNLRIADESIDLANQIAKLPVVSDSFRAKALQARIRHALAVYDRMSQGASADDMIEIGATLAYQSATRGEAIGELLEEVQRRRPATMWLTGLQQSETAPRYDLMKIDYSGPLSPSAAIVIAQWGIAHEGLSTETVADLFGHMADMAAPYPEWSAKWHTAASALNAHV